MTDTTPKSSDISDERKLINIALGLMDSPKDANIVSEVANLLRKLEEMQAKADDYDRLAEVARNRRHQLERAEASTMGAEPMDEYDRMKAQKDRIIAKQQMKDCKCDECGKAKSDGWALYCVSCSEVLRPATPTSAPVQASALGNAGRATVLVHGRNELHLKFNNDAELRQAYLELDAIASPPAPQALQGDEMALIEKTVQLMRIVDAYAFDYAKEGKLAATRLEVERELRKAIAALAPGEPEQDRAVVGEPS